MENRKGSGIFLGVIGVATLIVAIIGATFAYFSATANSNVDAIGATSTTLALGFEESNLNLKTHLIPASTVIAKYAALEQSGTGNAANQQCIDDNANEVCSYYEFTVGNPNFTTAQDIFASLNIQTNDFTNLFMTIVDEEDAEVVAPFNLANATDSHNVASACTMTTATDYATPEGCKVEFSTDGKKIYLHDLDQQLLPSSLGSAEEVDFVESTPSTYALVESDGKANKKLYKVILYIYEIGNDQTSVDAGQSFAAGITFSTGSGNSGVTGVISSAR